MCGLHNDLLSGLVVRRTHFALVRCRGLSCHSSEYRSPVVILIDVHRQGITITILSECVGKVRRLRGRLFVILVCSASGIVLKDGLKTETVHNHTRTQKHMNNTHRGLFAALCVSGVHRLAHRKRRTRVEREVVGAILRSLFVGKHLLLLVGLEMQIPVLDGVVHVAHLVNELLGGIHALRHYHPV